MKKNQITAFVSLLLLILLLFFTKSAAQGAREGIRLCGRVLIPSLFPFMVLSAMASPCLPQRAGLAPFALGFAAGYPMGVRTVCAHYRAGITEKTEARRQLFFCANCGCGFLVGTLGAGLFGSTKTGLFLLLVQVLSAVILAALSRLIYPPCPSRGRVFLPPCSLLQAVEGAILPMSRICALCILFCGLGQALSPLFSLLPLWGEVLCRGLFELTSGISAGAALELCPASLALLSGIAGFGGACVHAQSMAELSRAGLPAGDYLLGKALQGALCFGICYIFASIFPFCW